MDSFEGPKNQINASSQYSSSVRSQVPERTLEFILRIIIVCLLLFFFLVGVKTLEGSFKFLGADFAKTLFNVTSNPFIALMIGILGTTLFQSSSVTTSIIVGIVSAGTVSLSNAVPMIMGANLGTTVTNTLVSLGYIKGSNNFKKAFAAGTVHDFFNILTILILLPLEIVTGLLSTLAKFFANMLLGTFEAVTYTGPVKAAIKPFVNSIKYLITDSITAPKLVLGIIMMIIAGTIIISSLGIIVRLMSSLVQSNKGKIINQLLLKNSFMTIIFGFILTIMVQSSSITTSLLIPLAGSGLLTLEVIFQITIGANIGTTATALLASMTGNVYGLSIALVHLIFNILGALIWYVHPKMRQIPIWCATKLSEKIAGKKLLGVVYAFTIFFVLPFFLIYLAK